MKPFLYAGDEAMEVDVALKLAVPDVVNVDCRFPCETCRCRSPPDDRGCHVDLLSYSPRRPSDHFSSRHDVGIPSTPDFGAMCRTVAVDPGARLVQSSVTGDWRFVTSISPDLEPQGRDDLEFTGTRSGLCRYGSILPRDMGVDLSPGLSSSSGLVDVGTVTPASSVCQVDLSLRASGDIDKFAANMVLASSSSVSSAVTGVKCSPHNEVRDAYSLGNAVSVLSGQDHGVMKNSALARYTGASHSERELTSRLPSLNEPVTDVIQTLPSDGRRSDSVVLYSPDIVDTDKNRNRSSRDGSVLGLRGGVSNIEVAKNCALSTQFANDADLEADLLSARLLREFREAIKSAVDSISSGRSQQDVDDLPVYTSPPYNPSFLSGEHTQMCHGSFQSSPASILSSLSSHSLSDTEEESRTDSSFRRFRMSNIPTLNGLNRCRTSVVRDDLTTATQSLVTQNVLRHRRSLPDANQLRCLSSSSSSRDAKFPSRTDIRMRSSFVVGAFTVQFVEYFPVNSYCQLFVFWSRI